MSDYLPLLTMLVLATLFAGLSFFASTLLVLAVLFCVVSAMVSKLVSPKAMTAAKAAPYECGIVPRRDATRRRTR